MNKTQKIVFDLIKDAILHDYPMIKDKSNVQLARLIFKNYRENTGYNNLNLTIIGYNFLKDKIKFYDFNLYNTPFTTEHIIWLDRTQKYPYHYNEFSNIFSTSCLNLSMQLKLSDGILNLG